MVVTPEAFNLYDGAWFSTYFFVVVNYCGFAVFNNFAITIFGHISGYIILLEVVVF